MKNYSFSSVLMNQTLKDINYYKIRGLGVLENDKNTRGKIRFCIESNFHIGGNDKDFDKKSDEELDDFLNWYQSIFEEGEIDEAV